MSQLLEVFMVVCFGLSWPMSIAKAYRARSAKGKSLAFLLLIETGYICGIGAKIAAGNITYVLVFYVLNALMLLVEIGLYFRNSAYDKKAG